MSETAGKWVAHVWRASSGKVIHRRAFKTEWGVIRFAEEQSRTTGIREVTVTCPHSKNREWGPRYGVARDGQFTNDHNTEETAIMAKTTSKPAAAPADDAGEDIKDVARRRTSSRAAKPKPAVKRTGKAVEWPELLKMADSAIMKVEQGKRPNPKTLDGLKHADDNYTRSYVNFLTGERKHPVQAFMHKIPAEDGMARRNALRKAIAKHLGLKPSEIRLESKPGAKPAAAARRRGASTTVRTTAKRSTRKAAK